MAGFDPVVIVISILAGAIVVFLMRMLSQQRGQTANGSLRTAAVASSTSLSVQSLSDIGGKSPTLRSLSPRIEASSSIMGPGEPEGITAGLQNMLSIDSQKPTGSTDGAKSETPLENETGSGSAEIRLN